MNKDIKMLITKSAPKSYLFNFCGIKKYYSICCFEEYSQNLYRELVNSEKNYKLVLSEFIKNE